MCVIALLHGFSDESTCAYKPAPPTNPHTILGIPESSRQPGTLKVGLQGALSANVARPAVEAATK